MHSTFNDKKALKEYEEYMESSAVIDDIEMKEETKELDGLEEKSFEEYEDYE
jgi:hypothetical protein